MHDALLRVVLQDNTWLERGDVAPWCAGHLPEPFLARKLVLRAKDRVCLVVGPRQAGKSTLIWKHLAQRGRAALYLNCEEPAIREWTSSAATFMSELGQLGKRPAALFLDEVQRLPEAGLFLKGLVDRRTAMTLYATGSSSFDLAAATRESLAGRAERHLLLPLSIAEAAGRVPPARALADRRYAAAARRMLLYGGYTTVVLGPQPEAELAGLVEAFVVRDASDRFRVQRLPAFRRILELAAGQVGSLCNYSEWAAVAGISNDTVDDYVGLLEETHIVRTLRPFAGGRRSEVTRARKIFFLDNGIRNVLCGGFAPERSRADRGALHENLVLTEIAKTVSPLLDDICYWRSKAGAEVDFVVRHRGRLAGVEVKAGAAGGRLSRSARSFLEAYRPELMLVVSEDPPRMTRHGTTRVRWIRLWEVAPALAAFLG
ncbi:MAG: ATP-binding protein [Deltaproteobacteria bacterium]|nr:ATP-binding protein [Deltaproteobacteria bacterium]